jgi:autotransporter-associated beta strand protein/autotransporter passenger strand-loop-strand repeat protein
VSEGISAGGNTVSALILSGGVQNVSAGGEATGTIISGGGLQNVKSDGLAQSTDLLSGGALSVEEGGSALGVGQAVGGILRVVVEGGGLSEITGTNENGAFSLSSGVAEGFILYDQALMEVLAGGLARDTSVREGGLQHLSSGGTSEDVIVESGGTLEVETGSFLAGVNVLGGGATLAGVGVTLRDDLTELRVEADTDSSIAASLSGAGSLVKLGSGALTLSAVNEHGGGTVVSAGTLALSGLGTIGNGGAGDLTLHSGTVLDIAGHAGPPMPALGSLTLYGSDLTAVTGANSLNLGGTQLFYYLGPGVSAGDAILTVQGAVIVDAGTLFSLGFEGGPPALSDGDTILLVDAAAIASRGFPLRRTSAPNGDMYWVYVDPNDPSNIVAMLGGFPPFFGQYKAISESRAASLAFVGQGAELLFGQGMESAVAATSGPGTAFGPFWGLSYGQYRYQTGSHVDVGGLSALLGAAVGLDAPGGRLTLGAFLEGGWGNFGSFNEFSGLPSVIGFGKTDYIGGGVLARYDLAKGPLSGLYLEAAARAGRAKGSFGSADLPIFGGPQSMEMAYGYRGLLGGIGYIVPLGGGHSLDLSGKLIWTRQKAVDVAVGDLTMSMEKSDSLRLRLGGRLDLALSESVRPFIGAYFDRELKGELRSGLLGQRLDSPSLRGNSGMGELGVRFKPGPGHPLTLELAAQGFLGKRKGMGGSLLLTVEFCGAEGPPAPRPCRQGQGGPQAQGQGGLGPLAKARARGRDSIIFWIPCGFQGFQRLTYG